MIGCSLCRKAWSPAPPSPEQVRFHYETDHPRVLLDNINSATFGSAGPTSFRRDFEAAAIQSDFEAAGMRAAKKKKKTKKVARPAAKVTLGKEDDRGGDLPKAAPAPADKAERGLQWVRLLSIHDCLAVPVGTPVLVLADDRRIVATRTTHKAHELGGQPVVDLEGFDHPYAMRLVYVRGRIRP